MKNYQESRNQFISHNKATCNTNTGNNDNNAKNRRISKRIRERRRNRFMIKFSFASVIILVLCFTFGSFYSYAKSEKEEEQTYKYYTSIQIAEGDTLTALAARYISKEYKSNNQYIEEVKQMNHLKDDCIHAGQYLIVPYYSVIEK